MQMQLSMSKIKRKKFKDQKSNKQNISIEQFIAILAPTCNLTLPY